MKSLFHLPMAFTNSGCQRIPTRRRRLKRRMIELGDLVDLVRDDADSGGLSIDLRLDHHETRVGGIGRRGHAEPLAKIGQRNDLASDVEDAGDETSSARDLRDRDRVEDLAHELRVDREDFAGEADHEDLVGSEILPSASHRLHLESLVACLERLTQG